MPTIEELKNYLGIDGGHLDSLLADFLNTAKELVEKVLRYQIGLANNPMPSLIKEALRYSVAYLYNNRESANFLELERTLATLLQSLRKGGF
jgi:hypothetical protein